MISGIVMLVLGGVGLCVIIYFKFQDEPTKEARIFRVVDEYDNGTGSVKRSAIKPKAIYADRSFSTFPKNPPDKYIVFDLETTGLDCHDDYIVQIGALRVVNDEIIDSMSCYVTIPIRMPYSAFKIHGIDNAKLEKEGIEEKSALERLKKFSGNLPMLAYNAEFDGSFYTQACRKHDIEISNDIFCIMYLARLKWPGLPSYKLIALAKFFGIAKRQEHDALKDAKMALDVLKIAIAKRRKKQLEDIAESGEIPFDKHILKTDITNELATFLGCNEKTLGLAERLGVKIKKNTTLQTRFLVVGSGVGAAWKYTKHKNNIEKAISYRDERKKPLLIISERMFIHAAMQHIK